MINNSLFIGILVGMLLMGAFYERSTVSVPQAAQAQQSQAQQQVNPDAGRPQLQPAPAQGQAASQAGPLSTQAAVQYNQNSATGNMGGMTCPMMSTMGMGGMSMGTGGMSQAGMGHTMDQGLTMKEIVFIMSTQDTLQIMNDIIRIQEELIEDNGAKKTNLRQELAEAKKKTGKLVSDYREMLTSQVKKD